MAQQHASQILPIRFGDLTCNGSICNQDATTLRVVGDQTSQLSCVLLLVLVASCGTLALTQFNLLWTCCNTTAAHALNAPRLGTCSIKPRQATTVLNLPSTISVSAAYFMKWTKGLAGSPVPT